MLAPHKHAAMSSIFKACRLSYAPFMLLLFFIVLLVDVLISVKAVEIFLCALVNYLCMGCLPFIASKTYLIAGFCHRNQLYPHRSIEDAT